MLPRRLPKKGTPVRLKLRFERRTIVLWALCMGRRFACDNRQESDRVGSRWSYALEVAGVLGDHGAASCTGWRTRRGMPEEYRYVKVDEQDDVLDVVSMEEYARVKFLEAV